MSLGMMLRADSRIAHRSARLVSAIWPWPSVVPNRVSNPQNFRPLNSPSTTVYSTSSASERLSFECLLTSSPQELGMSHLATGWSRLRAWSASHGPELRLCVRSTTAAVVTLAVSQLLNLPIALWAVLTAVILTQISVGRSFKATTDYLVTTLGGAVYAGA